MNLVAFAASNSRNSINRILVRYAVDRLRTEFLPDARHDVLDLNDFEMPIFSIDRERAHGIPDAASSFFGRLGAADALLVSFAEHNGNVTAAWKNMHDWMSRIDQDIWQGKPMVVMAAVPGRRGGANVLAIQEKFVPVFGGRVCGLVGIGGWSEAWNAEEGRLNRPEDIDALDSALSGLASAIEGQ